MTESQFRWCAGLAIVLASLLAYTNTFSNDFVWDDASSILLHKHVQDPSQFLRLFREDLHTFGRGQGNFYRPLLAASFMLDYALSRPGPEQQPSPFFFHLGNLVWHVAAALFLFALLTRLEAPRGLRTMVSIIFAIHPLQTEAVTYISGRGDCMAAAFMFAGLWGALLEGNGLRRLTGTVLSTACFAAALLSKESAAIYPFLLLLLALGAPPRPQDTSLRQAFLGRLAPLSFAAVTAVLYGVLRVTVLHFGPETALQAPPFLQRVAGASKALALYVRLLFVPTGLHMERTLDGVPDWAALAGAAFLLVWLALAVGAVLRGQPRLALGAAWFLITWLPVSGLFPLNAPMAEHWLYVPLAGFFWALGEAIRPLVRRPPFRYPTVALCYAACLFFMVLTVDRNRDWHDNESLFRATLAENPRSIRAHFNLAVTYEDILGNPAGARRHYQQVLHLCQEGRTATEGSTPPLRDEEIESHFSLGRIFQQAGQYDRAANHYNVLVQLEPTDETRAFIAEAAYGLALCYLAAGDHEHAQPLLERARQLRPDLQLNTDSL